MPETDHLVTVEIFGEVVLKLFYFGWLIGITFRLNFLSPITSYVLRLRKLDIIYGIHCNSEYHIPPSYSIDSQDSTYEFSAIDSISYFHGQNDYREN